jgi:hypothetical protein
MVRDSVIPHEGALGFPECILMVYCADHDVSISALITIRGQASDSEGQIMVFHASSA